MHCSSLSSTSRLCNRLLSSHSSQAFWPTCTILLSVFIYLLTSPPPDTTQSPEGKPPKDNSSVFPFTSKSPELAPENATMLTPHTYYTYSLSGCIFPRGWHRWGNQKTSNPTRWWQHAPGQPKVSVAHVEWRSQGSCRPLDLAGSPSLPVCPKN